MNKDYDYLEAYHIHGDFYEIPDKVISDLVEEIEDLTQALNEIREYVNSDKLLGRLCEPKINNKGETHFDLIREDILQIIDKFLGGV